MVSDEDGQRPASAGKSQGRSAKNFFSAISAIPRRLVTPLGGPVGAAERAVPPSPTGVDVTTSDRYARGSTKLWHEDGKGKDTGLGCPRRSTIHVHTPRTPPTLHSAGGTLCVTSSRTWLLRARSRDRTRSSLTRSPPTPANQYRTRRSETYRTKQHRRLMLSTRVLRPQAVHLSPTTDPENLQTGAAGMAARGG